MILRMCRDRNMYTAKAPEQGRQGGGGGGVGMVNERSPLIKELLEYAEFLDLSGSEIRSSFGTDRYYSCTPLT